LAAQRLVSSSKFESLILLCIFVNCLFLAMAEPAVAPDYSSDPAMDALLRGADYVFTCIFGVEMVCKLVALGLACHAGAYLRSPWNWLDGAVVLFSILGLVPATQELVNGVGALRTIRLLRPLRTVNRIESMRTTVKALITATPRLIHVGLLCACCFFVFGIVGVQLFSGVLRNRCHTRQGGDLVLLEAATPCGGGNQCLRERQRLSGLVEPPAIMSFESTAPCSTLDVPSWQEGDVYCCEPTLPPYDSLAYWNSQAGCLLLRTGRLLPPCSLPPTCHPPATHLHATCLPPACHPRPAHGLPTHWHPQHALRSGNPHFGLISFDNVPVAFLLIFQAITLEGWTDIMSYLMNGVSPFFGGVYMVRPRLTRHPPPDTPPPDTRHRDRTPPRARTRCCSSYSWRGSSPTSRSPSSTSRCSWRRRPRSRSATRQGNAPPMQPARAPQSVPGRGSPLRSLRPPRRRGRTAPRPRRPRRQRLRPKRAMTGSDRPARAAGCGAPR
jgi:hypothetical protein